MLCLSSLPLELSQSDSHMLMVSLHLSTLLSLRSLAHSQVFFPSILSHQTARLCA
jgi:hypothetical protein